MQIIQAILALKKLVGWAIEGVKALSAYLFARGLRKQEEKTAEAEKHIKEANIIEEDQRRLAEKAKAVRELEDSLHRPR